MTKAQFMAVTALAEAIRELDSVPSGKLYASVMGHMSLEVYESFIAALERCKLISVDGSHLIRWTGPSVEAKQHICPAS